MPTDDLKCPDCKHEFEHSRSIKDNPPTKCPKCGKNKVKKVWKKAPGVDFRGPGWTPKYHN